ncbi:MAG: bifunctional glutamate N-acetyltransferase/amino-acid acetyltransferase ArgJ [Anaerovoracaceae bacterium]
MSDNLHSRENSAAVDRGGVCAPRGFRAGGVHCGIRDADESKNDLALIVSEVPCAAAAVYTTNKVKGAPLAVTRAHLADGRARAVIVNSGNANTCAPGGVETAEEVCRLTASELGCRENEVLVASTGVIGEELHLEPFERGIPELVRSLGEDGSDAAARGIMTTDTVKKEEVETFTLDGHRCTIGGIAKGSGMIHPNMATMLAFITTDVRIAPDMLQRLLREDIRDTFNQLSVDGDTSTNDMVLALASGLAGNDEISGDGTAYRAFAAAFRRLTTRLVRGLAADGEGAGKLIECHVAGARTKETARIVARSVVSSNLLKAAIFGEDANWGRVLCAIGYAPGDFSTARIAVAIASDNGRVVVCRDSQYYEHSEEQAARVLAADAIRIEIDLGEGDAEADAWGCDLTYDYVRINGDYRS